MGLHGLALVLIESVRRCVWGMCEWNCVGVSVDGGVGKCGGMWGEGGALRIHSLALVPITWLRTRGEGADGVGKVRMQVWGAV